MSIIALLLLIGALISGSIGALAADEEPEPPVQNGHCEDWEPGRSWDNSDGPGRDHDGDGKTT